MASDLIKVQVDPDKLRRARGVRKAREVADLIGVSQQTLSNWENGVCGVPGDKLARLCILYNVRIEALTDASAKILDKEYAA
jgi:transcriptional regulator with XRE-family HTH domain